MRKIRMIALLTALCLLAVSFTACKRKNEEQTLTGGPSRGENQPSGEEQTPSDPGVIVDPTPLAAIDLTAEVSYTEEWPELRPDADFCAKQMDFSVELFRRAAQKTRCKNTLIAPISVSMALAMTANGADGKTAEEMLAVLGDHSVDELNAYFGNWQNDLLNDPRNTLRMANSIWIRDLEGFEAKDAFLANNAKFYRSRVFKTPFNKVGVAQLNRWVEEKTDGMIPVLMEELRPDTMMVLVNALAFDAQWNEPYLDHNVHKETFTTLDGKTQPAKMMYSTESRYLEGEGAVGFLRPYAGSKYSFGAILPAEGTFEKYVQNLTGEQLTALLQNKQSTVVRARLPQFSNESSIILNDTLKEMGMPSAFDGGFGKMSNMDLLIGEVLHKSVIEVTQSGTRAAAVTAVSMDKGTAPMVEPKTVTLDRPFIYFILDNETNLPIFMGTVTSL